jgi:SAM-dependent methyltransferase
MKEKIRKLLKSARLYHPLQSFYRTTLRSAEKLYNRYAYSKYKGSGFTCNVCQSSYQKFAPNIPAAEDSKALSVNKVIAGKGENIICPYCLSGARERLVLGRLAAMDLQGRKILHFSPEKNIFRYISQFASVITADLSPAFYKATDKAVTRADATDLAYSDAMFDIVIANHIMEHIPDDRKAMSEIFRVLKPGGQAILQVPYSESIPGTLEQPGIADPALQSALFGQKDHVRIYLLEDYMERLRSAGFKVLKISYAELSYLHRYAIQKDECFMQITKPIS